jgi:hypothetical protein
MKIHQFVFEKKSLLADLKSALQKESLELQRFSPPRAISQGIEEVWMCCDESGQLFSIQTIEVNDKNAFGLEKGAVAMIIGPHEKSAGNGRVKKSWMDSIGLNAR